MVHQNTFTATTIVILRQAHLEVVSIVIFLQSTAMLSKLPVMEGFFKSF